MKAFGIISAVLLSIVVCGCPGTARGPGKLGPGEVGHSESGILFPDVVNGFVRGEIRCYDSVGRDVSAGYDLVDVQNLIAMTVYVHPAPKLISIGSSADFVESVRRTLTDSAFEGVKAGIMEVHPDGLLVSEGESEMQFRGKSLYGRSAKFKWRQRFAHQVQPVISHAEIFAFGKWLIKFRATHAVASADKAKETIEEFKKAFCEANKEVDK
jgi:hypothetical protein